jgi:DNA polymerase
VTLQLDPRRVAMLQEMGLRLLPPLQAAPVADVPAPVEAEAAVPPAQPVPVSVPGSEVAVPGPVVRLTGERPAGIAQLDWTALQEAVAGCRACGLCESRRNTVFGVGPQQADWMVVGEAPGENEDLQGEPFVGQAGKLLDNMLRTLGLDRRTNVYIANVLKCRPPGNRNPEPQEVAQCEPFLRRQVELLQPKIILAMGRFAIQTLLQSTEPVGRLRGRVHQYQGVPVVVTYHPAYLLRNLPDKAKAWADLCLAMEIAEGQSGASGR